jgi:hypothetical protein
VAGAAVVSTLLVLAIKVGPGVMVPLLLPAVVAATEATIGVEVVTAAAKLVGVT